MIKRTVTITRPTTAVEFPNIMEEGQTVFSSEVKSYIIDNFVNTNKLAFGDRVESANGLELTLVSTWADQAAIDAYNADPYIIANLISVRGEYINQNAIITAVLDEVI